MHSVTDSFAPCCVDIDEYRQDPNIFRTKQPFRKVCNGYKWGSKWFLYKQQEYR